MTMMLIDRLGVTLTRIVKSLFSTIVGTLAERISMHPSVPPENRQALRETAQSVIASELQRMFGGDQLRLYIPRVSAEQRQQRDERIGDALVEGVAADDVAQRERLSDRHVRRLRGRIGGF
jgi:hypothetical protein